MRNHNVLLWHCTHPTPPDQIWRKYEHESMKSSFHTWARMCTQMSSDIDHCKWPLDFLNTSNERQALVDIRRFTSGRQSLCCLVITLVSTTLYLLLLKRSLRWIYWFECQHMWHCLQCRQVGKGGNSLSPSGGNRASLGLRSRRNHPPSGIHSSKLPPLGCHFCVMWYHP